MKMRVVVSALASLTLMAGVALAQTSPAQPSPSAQGNPSEAAPSGGTLRGNEGQTPPAGTATNPSQQAAPAPGGLPAEIKSGGQPGAAEGGNLPFGAVAFQATKHIAVVNAALVTGATNANMLEQIAATPASYDPEHGQALLSNMKQAVTQADAYLVHLKPMAHGNAMSQLQDIQGRLDHVKDMLPKMEAELTDPKALASDAGKCANQLHGGMAPLKNVSSTMHAKVTLGSTG